MLEIREIKQNEVNILINYIKKIADYEKLSDKVNISESLLYKNLFVDKSAYSLLVLEDNEVVGYVVYYFNFSTFMGNKGLYIEDIFIDIDKRHNGIGKKVFEYIEYIAKYNNCSRMEWVCLNWNESAKKFYESLNAKPQSEWLLYRLTKSDIDGNLIYSNIKDILFETPKVYLRRYTLTDLEDFYNNSKVEGVGEKAGWIHHKSIEESKTILESFFINSKSEFAIVLKETNKVVGSFGIRALMDEDIVNGFENKLGASIGYVLSPLYHNKGIMTELVKAVVNTLFNKTKIEYIVVGHFVDNICSRRVIEKSGFTHFSTFNHDFPVGTRTILNYYRAKINE